MTIPIKITARGVYLQATIEAAGGTVARILRVLRH